MATNTGVNASERFLTGLCRRSFLRLWTYTGVSRDQTPGNGNRLGKEICDVLAIFDNHILIFSDKFCAFPTNCAMDVAWGRWYRRAILNSAEQIIGAERWLRQHPDRVYTDLSCRFKLPITIPNPNEAIYHRIVVAHGASEACVRFYEGGSGSLVIDNNATGKEPFCIGKVHDSGFVHVFDDVSLEIALRALDTIPDFIAYLTKKELLLQSHRHVVAAGEEELLGAYSVALNEVGEHDFVLPETESDVLYKEGHWNTFINSSTRQRQEQANQISYSWDALIETFTHHSLSGTHRTTTQPDLAEQEVLYRWLARENRTRRRMLSRAFMGIIKRTPPGHRAVRIVSPSLPADPYFVFLVVPRSPDDEESKYRDVREWLLQQYCITVKLHDPAAARVIGLATECGDVENRSEDLVYVSFDGWSPAMESHARELQTKLGLLAKIEMTQGREYEFPKFHEPLRGPGEFVANVAKKPDSRSRKERHRDLVNVVSRQRR